LGEKVTSKKLAFITVEPSNGHFEAFLSVEGLLSIEGDPELVLQDAAKLYERAITTMRSLIAEMHDCRIHRKPILARMMWKLGDTIFKLRDELKTLSLELDDTYGHLVRDLNVKRKWLEKVIIFRRYIPDEDLIPESLNWGRCEKGTRRVAERLRENLSPD
jgi:hypothetical protein